MVGAWRGTAAVLTTPGLMVQGRYLVPATGSHEELLAGVDQSVARVRAEPVR